VIVVPWVVNDTWTAYPQARLRLRLVSDAGESVALGEIDCPVPEDSLVNLRPLQLEPDLAWPAGPGRLELALESGGETLSSNEYRVSVISEPPSPRPQSRTPE
jgi:hypothetical protein